MAFQIPQFTQLTDWLIVDTKYGTEILPLPDLGTTKEEILEYVSKYEDEEEGYLDVARDFSDHFSQFVNPFLEDDLLFSAEVETGYGARLSAPGYMDCTEWTIHSSPTAAINYIRDTYLDDEFDSIDPDFDCIYRREEQLSTIRWMKGQ